MSATPDPTTRAPASKKRQAAESLAGAAPATLLVYWALQQIPEMDEWLRISLAGGIGAEIKSLFSLARDRGVGGGLTGAK